MKRLPWLLLLSALLLPALALAPHSQHVFWLPESVFWSILAPWAAFAAWLSTRRDAPLQWPPYLKPLFAALALLWSLAAAFSLRKDLAAQALIECFGYAAIFFATWRLAATKQRRRTLLAALFAYAIVSAFYGVVQAAGWDPIQWSTGFGGRAAAFFGNPNFLGGHLALLLPLSLALALDRRGNTRRPWAPWALVALLGLTLLLTQTRGAWIGAAAGCTVVLVLAQRWMGGLPGRNRKALLGLLALSVLSLGAFFGLKPGATGRLREALNSEDSELTRRFFLMKKASQLASLKPLLGVGPGNFRIQFARVQVQGLEPLQFKQPYVVSEHAHNDFLQMAAEAGVPAALIWAALMGAVLMALGTTLLKGRGDPARGQSGDGLIALGVLGGIVALLVHGLANFPFLIVPTQAAAWALAALALRPFAPALQRPSDEGLVDGPASTPAALPPPSRAARSAFAAAAALAFAFCAANTVRQGQRLGADRFWWIGQGELALQHDQEASTWLLAGLGLEPREDRLWALHGRSETGRELIWNSIGSLRRAHELAPYDPEVAVLLGRALVENKQYDEGLKVLSGAAQYAPNFYDLWEPLAACYYFLGQHAEAVKAYDWMIFFNVNPENAYVNKAAAQGSEGQLPEALLTLQNAQRGFPKSGKIYINLAITYLKLGMRAEAKTAWKQAAELIPSDPQVDQLRKILR